MKRFVAQLNDGSFINIPADAMQMHDTANAILVFEHALLVAFVDAAAVIHARICEKGEKLC